MGDLAGHGTSTPPREIQEGDLRYRYVNRAWVARTGRMPEDVLGKRDEQIYDSRITDVYLPALRRCAASGEPQSIECDFGLPTDTLHFVVKFVPLMHQRRIQQVLGVGCHVE